MRKIVGAAALLVAIATVALPARAEETITEPEKKVIVLQPKPEPVDAPKDAAAPAKAETAEGQSKGSVREVPADPAKAAPKQEVPAKKGQSVFLRAAPLALAANGRPLDHTEYAWYPDLVTLGFGFSKTEFQFSITAQEPNPQSDRFGLMYGRTSVVYRPARLTANALVDLYVYGGGGFGGVGNYVRIDPQCESTPTGPCGRHYARWGGDVHAGLGVDFALPITRFESSGQTMAFTIGLDARATVFFNQSKASPVNFFGVYSIPIGLRWD